MHPELIIFHPDPAYVKKLKEIFPALPFVSIQFGQWGNPANRLAPDAQWMPWMRAHEYTGRNPPFPLLSAEVIPMPQLHREDGYPPLVIAGVRVPRGYKGTLDERVTLVVRCMRDAVAQYNLSHPGQPIRQVAMLALDLLIQELGVQRVAKILREEWSPL